MGQNSHIVDFSQVYKLDEDLVSRKAHELAALWKLGIPLPRAFVITTDFYKDFLRLADIDKKIYKSPALKHPALSDSMDNLFQTQIMHTPIPQALVSELHHYYNKLSGIFKNRPLDIFSSSLNNKSIFFSNVMGDANLIMKIKTIWSMSFKKPMAIVAQESIKSDFQGKTATNNLIVDNRLTKNQMDKLIEYCKIIQKHFYFPKEIEYAVKNNKLFITQVNPFTGTINDLPKKIPQSNETQKIKIKGISINQGIATGRVGKKKGEIVVLPTLNPSMFKKIKLAKAVIIDTISQNSLDKALFREAFHFPAIEGAKNATHLLHNGNIITVNGLSGEIYSGGLIY